MSLTPRQNAVLESLIDYYARTGRPPTHRELGRRLRLSHHRVAEHLAALDRAGAIRQEPRISRGITILPP
jgi:SOS-response transcriptional repressor LexA